MSRSFLIAVTMLAAFVVPVAGAEVPAQYRGLWCEARDGTYYRCQVGNSDSSPDIHRNYLILTEEGRCSVVTVTPKAGDHRLRLRCDADARTYHQSEVVNLRIDARGRLHLHD